MRTKPIRQSCIGLLSCLVLLEAPSAFGHVAFPSQPACTDANRFKANLNLQDFLPLAYPSDMRVVNLYWKNGWHGSGPDSSYPPSPWIDDATQHLIESSPYFHHLCQYTGTKFHWEHGGDTSGSNPCVLMLDAGSTFGPLDPEYLLVCQEASPDTVLPTVHGSVPYNCLLCGTTSPCVVDPLCRKTPNPTGDLLVNVFLPPYSDGLNHCNAYHFVTVTNAFGWPLSPIAGTQGRPIIYTIIPTQHSCYHHPDIPDGPLTYNQQISLINQIMESVSHEMVEALIDEHPGAEWFSTFTGDGATLFKDLEAADICENVVEECGPVQANGTAQVANDICTLGGIAECDGRACQPGSGWVHYASNGQRVPETPADFPEPPPMLPVNMPPPPGGLDWFDRDNPNNRHRMALGPYWSNKDEDCIAPGDEIAPNISVVLTPSQNKAGWNNSSITITISANDFSGLGIDHITYSIGNIMNTVNGAGSTSFTFDAQGISTLLVQAEDGLGGFAPDYQQTISINKIDPTITASQTPAPVCNGWNNTDVTVSFDCTTTAHVVLVSCTPPVTLSSDGKNQTVTGNAVDISDRTATTSVSVNLDKTPPGIVPSQTPSTTTYGWNGRTGPHAAPVTVTFSCSDTTSGVQSCTAPLTFASEGALQLAAGHAVDNACNPGDASYYVNIDLTDPVITYSGVQAVYTVDQVVNINCSAADALSGIATDTCSSIAGPAYNFNIGSNVYSARATDRADNTTTAQVTFEVKVTFDSLCNLTRGFSQKQGIGDSLCAKLLNAEQAQNQQSRDGKLGAYSNEVSAQSGKAIPANQAAILQRLVTYLL